MATPLTLAKISIKDSSSWYTYLNLIYPVGSVYISYTSTSPATRFGGSWVSITGRFPYFNAGTTADGNNTTTLTYKDIPRHGHMARYGAGWGTGSQPDGLVWNSSLNSSWNWYTQFEIYKDATLTKFHNNESTSHSNMPAYQTFYAWRRTA